MSEELRQSIFKTLAFFDLFEYPLTREELYRFLWKAQKNLSPIDFLAFVDQYDNIKYIEKKNGFYFLQGREDVLDSRHVQTLETEKKMRIAKRGISKLRYIPFIRSVFVCNTVAGGYPTKESDIDVCIIVRDGRLWIARFFANLMLKILRLRTSATQERDKICLSFFISEKRLNLFDLRIADQDIYLAYWLTQLVPVYDPENLHESIMRANNWVKEVLPYAFQAYDLIDRWKVVDSKISLFFKKIGENLWGGGYGNLIEDQTKKIQMPKVTLHYGDFAKQNNSNVIIADDILKFHKNDRREEYRGRWLDHMVT
ncbi:MAG: hypothetical protein HYV41_00825 [Candidatus Magasanikbacteria bacterium]|nr:hypothetical protein [Candidatus Magasanikbacteria bacterium]